MVEALQFTAGIMFWMLINLILAIVWVVIIGVLISKAIGRKDE